LAAVAAALQRVKRPLENTAKRWLGMWQREMKLRDHITQASLDAHNERKAFLRCVVQYRVTTFRNHFVLRLSAHTNLTFDYGTHIHTNLYDRCLDKARSQLSSLYTRRQRCGGGGGGGGSRSGSRRGSIGSGGDGGDVASLVSAISGASLAPSLHSVMKRGVDVALVETDVAVSERRLVACVASYETSIRILREKRETVLLARALQELGDLHYNEHDKA
jgi:hypothetical protein